MLPIPKLTLTPLRYFEYAHSADSKYTVLRADSHYSVPRAVASHLDLVSPTNRFPPMRSKVTKSKPVESPDVGNTPEVLRKLYSVGDVEGSAPKNKMCATAFLGQFFKVSDLDKFWKE